jgi:hypothetical protein
MGQRGSITVVSDDPGWTEKVRAALRERGVGALPLLELTFGDGEGIGALLLDSRLAPHGGIELAEQLRLVLEDVCPPLLLSAPDPEALTDAERAPFFAVVRTADPASVADAAARELARLPATSGFVLRSGVLRARSGD